MTLIHALGIVYDLAAQNALREDQICDDEDDPLRAQLDEQQAALKLVQEFAALLEVE